MVSNLLTHLSKARLSQPIFTKLTLSRQFSVKNDYPKWEPGQCSRCGD